MTENHFKPKKIELNEIDLGFCKLYIIVHVDLLWIYTAIGRV